MTLLYYLTSATVGYTTIAEILIALGPYLPAAEFVGRLLLSWLCLLACASYGVVASIFLRIAGYGGLSQWTVARSFKWTMWAMTGVEFVIQGEENLKTRPAVFIGNHQTELDVLMLGAIFPPYCSVTAKKSLKYMPFLGWFMALSKTVFIDRGNRETARMAFESAAHQMKTERQSVYIFPEGTRSYSSEPDMLPFKKGAFHLAIQAQVPIVPVVVANYSNILHVQSKRFTVGRIPIKVLSPISTENLTASDVDDLARDTRELMMKELVQLTELARRQGVALSATTAGKLDAGSAVKVAGVNRKRAAVKT